MGTMNTRGMTCAAILFGWVWSTTTHATETEHLGIHILPAPGPVEIDGDVKDWDLSGGVFVCGDVENLRERLACWIHLMYDPDALYVLTRWIDETPLSNPGSSKGDYGFAGDCLQMRLITEPGLGERERTTHLTAWQDRDGIGIIDLAYGKQFDQGGIADAQTQGARQAFRVTDDGKGYTQELALPWRLIASEGFKPAPGKTMIVTVEPNFNTTANARITLKDIFREGVLPNRTFTFMASDCWGVGTFEQAGGIPPRPVRLADRRTFSVTLRDGAPVVDWSGLSRTRELKGFVPITLDMPADGHLSLQVVDAEGRVARQLLSAEFVTGGSHTFLWDGLSTPNWRQPGDPVPAGEYTWRGLWHKGVSLRLKGWAGNGGSFPWDTADGRGNWGGDHGVPVACASDGSRVYLGWSGAEAGKAIVAVDGQGEVQWRCSRGGMSGAEHLAVDGGTVYAVNWDGVLFRLDAASGGFSNWEGTGSTDLSLARILDSAPAEGEKPSALFAAENVVYIALERRNQIIAVDGRSGQRLRVIDVPSPIDIARMHDGRLLVLSSPATVLALDTETGEQHVFAQTASQATCLAVDRIGRVYVGVRDPDNHVNVLNPDGSARAAIGIPGGRPLLGRWNPLGMRFVQGITVDADDQLWVMEADETPKRVSVWNTRDGTFIREFFGPTTYGALGGSICPTDPAVMVGSGCEWRLDPETGRARCVSVITRDGMENARFGMGANGRLYLATAAHWLFNNGPIRIFERLGEGEYVLRTLLYYETQDGKPFTGTTGHGKPVNAARTLVWADENGDGLIQPGEVSGTPGELRFSGWYLSMTPDLTFYAEDRQYRVVGFTACGAPRYDLNAPVRMPVPGVGSADGRMVLQYTTGGIMEWLRGFDIESGSERWRYPDNFVGVHGSHSAPPAQNGMIRGSFGPCGTVQFPPPLGNVWVIPTNVGEWHMINEDGFYVTRLFQGNPMEVRFPEAAIPGALLDNAPPGLGGEDFGGSICLATNGTLHLQAGKTAFWNVEAVGLDTVAALPGGRLTVTDADRIRAAEFHAALLGETETGRHMRIVRHTPTFTGNLDSDFAESDIVAYGNHGSASARSAAAWDANDLYLAWDVVDDTPWINAASAPEFMYTMGDTVDFQLATDPGAPRDRIEPVIGDLRLSIGNFNGTPTAVLYQPRSVIREPKRFFSGVVREGYEMDRVTSLKEARIHVKTDALGHRYVVQAAIPLKALGIQPDTAHTLIGDFGVTHGDRTGRDTALRTHWSNDATGIVNDEVHELLLEPRRWGVMRFEP